MVSDDLAGLSLEELAHLEISSVSRKTESLASAAASVFVISAEEIHRIGATSLPEALRLAPNLQVAQYGAGNWAISARGFNSLSANKLVVLIDGRLVYSPLHSGVFWDSHDVYMPDVERIEVISGPNATTWGSNAVNGVINVVTRDAADTTGGNLDLTAGEQEQVIQARFGGEQGEDTHYRVYGKVFDADPTEYASGLERTDAIERQQAGFRMDFGGDQDSLTLQGDMFDGELGTYASDIDISGANLMLHWQRVTSSDALLDLTAWYDRTSRSVEETGLDENIDVFNASVSHQFSPADNHMVVWGSDVRHASDEATGTQVAAFIPAKRDLSWVSLFAQDEIQLDGDLALILGLRAEDNDYTGLEVMPNARVAWSPAANHSFWASLSRAVRTPTRLERDIYLPAEPPYRLQGGDFHSETADVIELGYRAQPSPRFSWSITAFHHEYEDLRTREINDDGVQEFGNGMRGTSTGLEGWWNWRPLEVWQLSGGFYLYDKDLVLYPDSTAAAAIEGNDPRQLFKLRSSWSMTDSTALELFVRYVGDLPNPAIPAYTNVDARVWWRATPDFEVAVKIDNLLDEEHAEFNAPDGPAIYGRYASLQLRWDYR